MWTVQELSLACGARWGCGQGSQGQGLSATGAPCSFVCAQGFPAGSSPGASAWQGGLRSSIPSPRFQTGRQRLDQRPGGRRGPALGVTAQQPGIQPSALTPSSQETFPDICALSQAQGLVLTEKLFLLRGCANTLSPGLPAPPGGGAVKCQQVGSWSAPAAIQKVAAGQLTQQTFASGLRGRGPRSLFPQIRLLRAHGSLLPAEGPTS